MLIKTSTAKLFISNAIIHTMVLDNLGLTVLLQYVCVTNSKLSSLTLLHLP